MKIVTPYAKMLPPNFRYDPNPIPFIPLDGIAMLKRIEYYARVSHASEDMQSDESYDRFLRSVVLQHGDLSVIEHEKVTCEFLVDRGITHEIVRHRIGSYTQESTRFVNYQKKGGEAKFIMPDGLAGTTQGAAWASAIEISENSYMAMISLGCKPQIARSVFPNALASKIIVTYNLRGWRHFFLMRTSSAAHPQMRQVTIPLLEDFKKNIPIIFEDIEPMANQSDNMKKMR
ncbi:MAG: FAD-dependent thymidylate synthase [Nitrospiraceae bacterium]